MDKAEREFIPTDEQQKVLDIKEGLHLVLAPPGSGKTELLAHRVFNAKSGHFQDNDIICLTFTNRAAKGMKERIEMRYPNNEIIIGNVHHFCSTFLFRNKIIPLNTSILDEEDTDQIFNELKNRFNYNPVYDRKVTVWDPVKRKKIEKVEVYNVKVYNPNLIKLATYLKQKELGFSEDLLLIPKQSEIPDRLEAEDLCKAYNKEKQQNNYLDFDDLLTLTYYHLKHTDKTKLSLSQFKWLQVDEVQDLNSLQWAIINEITSQNALVVYFGDYEQAIFSFMGAKLDSLHNIEKICKSNSQNSILNLCKNFRSPSYLLDIYIKYAEKHWEPTWKQRPYSHSLKEAPKNSLCLYKIEDSLTDEAKYIAKTIIPSLLVDDDNTAIIVRFNSTADKISEALELQNIPHFKISGFDIFRREEIKGLMAFLSIFENEYDRLSWARLLYEFKATNTLKESRTFINDWNKIGITPIDILDYNGKSSRLIEFFNIFSNEEMVVFDTETTGLDTKTDDIIQIAAIKISKGKIIDIFEVYINTDRDTTASEKIHHISKTHLDKFGVSHSEGLVKFIEFVGNNSVLVAHNVEYDKNILTHNLIRYCNKTISNNYFDSITIAKLIHPNFASYKLKNLLEFLKVDGINSHNALDDVKATVSLIEKLYHDFKNNIEKEHLRLLFNIDFLKICVNFKTKFKPLFCSTQKELNSDKQLSEAIKDYFDYKKIEKSQDINKLLKHVEYYTNDKLTLQQKIDKYIPEYRMFKESDLYLGTEKVIVSTVYKAKGLEFDNVLVSESTDETYPFLYPIKQKIAERQRCKVYDIKESDFTNEEKELLEAQEMEDAKAFYVAMTRSKKKLFITSHTSKVVTSGLKSYSFEINQSRFIGCISNYFREIEIKSSFLFL